MINKSDTDINYIIQMSLKGDKKYQEILLKELKPLLCKNIYMHWSINDPMIEDLLQEGYIVVLHALESFDINKGIHFLAFVKSRIKYFYLNCSRDNLKHIKNLNHINIDDMEICDIKENTEEKILKTEEISLLERCIEMLTEKEKQLIYLFYFDEIPIAEIAVKLNISYGTACCKKSQALKKLRVYMGR